VLRAGVLSGSTGAADVEALLAPLRADLLASRDANGIDGLLLLANARMEAGDHDDALALVRSAEANARGAALSGPLLSALVSDARTLQDAQRFGEAVEKSDEALAVWRSQGEPPNPDMVDLYGAIALGAEATGDMARAEAAGRDGIALGERIFDRPTRGFAWVVHEYGTFLVTQGRFDQAEPYVRRALDMRTAMFGAADPNTLDAVASLGKMYYWQGRYADSVRELDTAVAACGDHAVHDVICARVLALRARSLARAGRHGEAAADARAALARQLEFGGDTSPGYAWILDNVAVAELERGDPDAALATAERVLAIRGRSHTGMVLAELVTRFTRARALFELRRDGEALAELDAIEPRYASLYPRGGMHFDLLHYRARALARAQRGAVAREDAKRALDLAAGRGDVDAALLAELRRLAAASSP
jgi:serine/threonine-protein kinase